MIRFIVIYITAVILVGVAAGWGYHTYFSGGDPVRIDLGQNEAARDETATGQEAVQALPTLEVSPEPPRTFQPSPKPLSLPIDCEPGIDCWIINYVDADPGPGRADFACGDMSYDGHKGTDFALAHEGRIADGVAVLAAASGRVVGVRDGMADISIKRIDPATLDGRDCGNGVRIDHGDGWVAQYCHLRKGSVAVASGDVVRAGDRLGAVGMSGRTEFPHLHVTVEKDGRVVDPFVGVSGGPDCQMGDAPLWRLGVLSRLAYRAPSIFHAGFVDRQLSFEEIRTGAHTRTAAAPDAPALIFFAELAGVRPGDRLVMRLLAPDGTEVAALDHRFEDTQIRASRYVGRKVRGSWAQGVYRGIATITRDGRETQQEAALEVR